MIRLVAPIPVVLAALLAACASVPPAPAGPAAATPAPDRPASSGTSGEPGRVAPPRPRGEDPREAILATALEDFHGRRFAAAAEGFRRVLSVPVRAGAITDPRHARSEWERLRRAGKIDVSLDVAIDRGLLDVDRPALEARWYGRLTGVLRRGPGFRPEHVATTGHYRVVTDHSEQMAGVLAERLEAGYEEYARLLPPPTVRGNGPRLAVTFFARHEDYTDYLAEILQDRSTARMTTGSYHALFRELILVWNGDLDRTLLVLHHEGFHQFVDAASPGRVPPPWFGEGLADYFGAKLTTGHHPFRAAALRAAIDDPAPLGLGRLVRADHDTFMAARDSDGPRRRRTVGRNYALAYALAHFLVEDPEGGRPDALRRYLAELRAGGAPEAAFGVAFGDLDPDSLDADVRRHARSELLPGID